jgi:GRAM domain
MGIKSLLRPYLTLILINCGYLFIDYSCAYNGRQGWLYISENYLGFYSFLLGVETKVLVELKDIQDMKKEKSKRNMFSDSLLIATKDKQEVPYWGLGAYVYPNKFDIDFKFPHRHPLLSSTISRTCLGEMRYVTLAKALIMTIN